MYQVPYTLTGGDTSGKLTETKEGRWMGSSFISGGVFGMRERRIFQHTSLSPLQVTGRCKDKIMQYRLATAPRDDETQSQ